MRTQKYTPKEFNLSGLQGISDKTLGMHLKLYEGYVKATNTLNEHIANILQDGKVDQEEMPAYSELTRRLGFEYNGMVLHELYFENMTSQASTGFNGRDSLEKAIAESFGSFENWKTEFTSIGKMRGVGWAICYQNPDNGRLSNHWVSLHEFGNVAGFRPLLVMDVWEHAYLLDFQPSERGEYIESFLSNVDWDVVAKRQ
ncbi:MAG: Fe-Mn family superoxide dismutase [Nitrospirota bacterium]